MKSKQNRIELVIRPELHQGNHVKAQQSLEVGLSYNFQVRDHPLYHLINAKVLKDQGNLDEAISTLQVWTMSIFYVFLPIVFFYKLWMTSTVKPRL